MTNTSRFYKKTVEVEGRKFTVQLVQFDNGSFVSVAEGDEKLGAMVVSLGIDPAPVTTIVIPPKTEHFFLKFIAEKISSMKKGICIVSISFRKELETETAKILMRKILEMVENV